MFPLSIVVVTLITLAAALPITRHQRRQDLHTAISSNFQDPSILEVDGTWYSYAGVSGNPAGVNVLTASSTDFAKFDVNEGLDALPDAGPWTASPPHVWAPDVNRLNSGKFIMYYSASVASKPGFHCVGAAVSDNPLGPFIPQEQPLFCDLEAGGAIDSDGWSDPKTGKQYVVYKVDGNSVGNGGFCANTVEPIAPTPIMIQEVSVDNGCTFIGSAQQLLLNQPEDGANIEAPAMTYYPETDTYILFFNSHCFTTSLYTINYATSIGNFAGPYTRHDENPFLATGDTPANVYAPGGIDLTSDGKRAIFHGDLNVGWFENDGSKRVRGMYTIALDLNGDGVRPGALLS